MKEGKHVALAADLTAPLSWIKGPDCTVEGSGQKCTLLKETLMDKVKAVKKKVGSKLHKSKEADKEKEDAIIEGSSEVIRG